MASQLFKPFRVVGEITYSIPPVCVHHGTETFVTTSIGKSPSILMDLTFFAQAAHLNLLFVSPQHTKRISALAAGQKLTFTACNNEIYVWKRGKTTKTLKQNTGAIYLLAVFAEQFLLSVSEDNKLSMWVIKTGQLHLEMDLHGRATCILHPDTYLNKIMVGFEDGTLQLWNLKSKHLIYSCKGWGSPVRCMQQSPALDVLAIGLQNGRIYVHNIKFDETIVSFDQRDQVTALSFRTDGHAVLASGNTAGQVTLWHLERKKLITIMKDLHDGPVIGLHFFPNEPVMLTSGRDNAVKMWLFEWTDPETGTATTRLLRSRSGHSAPPHLLRYYNPAEILSAGTDRALRMTSIIQDQQSREISQGHVASRAKKLNLKVEELKLNPITGFDANPIKERDWDNIITCHENDYTAYTWSYQNKAMGKHALRSPSGDQTPITAVAMSACGHFCFTGSQSGHVEKFNIQSGQPRGSAAAPHAATVVGIQCDMVNRCLISGGLDKKIKIWNFGSMTLLSELTTPWPVNRLVFHRESSLLAVVLDDLSIYIYDIDTHNLVRQFQSLTESVTDMCWSPDSRWLVASTTDGAVRVWDVPSGQLIDWFRVKKPVTSLSFSPAGDFLATTHTDSLGISLWANQTYFANAFVRPVSAEASGVVSMPSASGPAAPDDAAATPAGGENGAAQADKMEDGPEQKAQSGTPLYKNLATLSRVHKNKLQAITNIELIKERNKPNDPPKAPPLAPFFLTTAADSTESRLPKFTLDGEAEAEQPAKKSRIISLGSLRAESTLRRLLDEAKKTGNYDPVVDYFAEASPSAIDLDIRTLSMADDFLEFKLLLEFFAAELDTRNNFELIQALLNVFLKAHGDILFGNMELAKQLEDLLEKQKDEWQRLQHMFQHNLCLVSHVSGIQL